MTLTKYPDWLAILKLATGALFATVVTDFDDDA
jgi:hypothetical protein